MDNTCNIIEYAHNVALPCYVVALACALMADLREEAKMFLCGIGLPSNCAHARSTMAGFELLLKMKLHTRLAALASVKLMTSHR